MTDERTIQALNERYKDMLRAAEQRRSLYAAAASPPPRAGAHQRVLAEAGRWLVALGQALQTRYGTASAFGPETSTYLDTSKYS